MLRAHGAVEPLPGLFPLTRGAVQRVFHGLEHDGEQQALFGREGCSLGAHRMGHIRQGVEVAGAREKWDAWHHGRLA